VYHSRKGMGQGKEIIFLGILKNTEREIFKRDGVDVGV